jgi:hypothetical protein
MPHDETRISGKRVIYRVHRVEVIFQIVLDRAIKQRGGRCAVGGGLQTACIAVHSASPIWWTFGTWR